MESITIRVIDFTEYPGVRYIGQGDDTGEEFYIEKIKPAFQKCIDEDKSLYVDLDDTAGYASSFLDECFGNLVYDFPYDEIIKRLNIISFQEPDWIDVIFEETLPEWLRKKNEGQPRNPH